MSDSILHQLWYRSLQCVCQVAAPLAFRLRVFGRAHVPCDGPVLIASSHQSFLDPVLIGVGLHREVHFLARDSLFIKPLFRKLITSLNALPLRRNETDIHAFRSALQVLKKNAVLVIFPEGTRTADGSLQRVRPGWVLLAARSGAAVVPAVVEGAHKAWPRNAVLPRPRPIRVAFGRAFHVDARARDAVSDATRRLEEEWNLLQTRLRRL